MAKAPKPKPETKTKTETAEPTTPSETTTETFTDAVVVVKPTAASTATTTQPAEKISKIDAIERAILNGNPTPKTGLGWIKEKYGLDVNVAGFNSGKQYLKSKGRIPDEGGSGSRSSKPKSTSATTYSPSKLAFDVKTLIEEYGMDEVRRMIEAAGLFMDIHK